MIYAFLGRNGSLFPKPWFQKSGKFYRLSKSSLKFPSGDIPAFLTNSEMTRFSACLRFKLSCFCKDTLNLTFVSLLDIDHRNHSETRLKQPRFWRENLSFQTSDVHTSCSQWDLNNCDIGDTKWERETERKGNPFISWVPFFNFVRHGKSWWLKMDMLRKW